MDFLAMVAYLEAESERRDADSKMSVEAQILYLQLHTHSLRLSLSLCSSTRRRDHRALLHRFFDVFMVCAFAGAARSTGC